MKQNEEYYCENNEDYVLRQIQDDVHSLVSSLNNVDKLGHRHYTENELNQAHLDLESLLDEAKDCFDKLLDCDSSNHNEEIYIEISALLEKIEAHNREILQAEIKKQRSTKYRKEIKQLNIKLLENYCSLKYDFSSAYDDLLNHDNIDFLESNDNDNMKTILLCKNVRIMEDIINKICSNNIDKSIINGEKLFESMQYGFEWLFCHNNILGNDSNKKYKRVDIRDKNRFLDFIKYQIMVSGRFIENSPKTSIEIDKHDKLMRAVFEKNEFSDKVTMIENFKKSVIDLINQFFDVYKILITYRDTIFIEEEIRKSINKSSNNNNSHKVRPKPNKEIVVLSMIALRVLIDRFVSFVKISDLNFGNSTFNRSWFNYSELSNSNYAGSNFKHARLENAKVQNCDLSTCNLSCSDGSCSDFSNSNFNYSNMTSMDLVNSTLNDCQFKNTLFRDSDLDMYEIPIEMLIKKFGEDIDEEDKSRIKKLLLAWNRGDNEVSSKELIDTISSCYENISLPDIQIKLKGKIQVLSKKDYNELIKTISNATNQFLENNLSSIISEELLVRSKELINFESDENKKTREKNYGKVLFDSANLTKVSAKRVQMPDMDFSHSNMEFASFEDSDISGSVMYYINALNVSFIRANMNNSNCFESNFESSNFSCSVLNKSNFINCNLNNTNWEKSILNGVLFIDASPLMEDCINSRHNELSLYIFEYQSLDNQVTPGIYSVIKDKFTYDKTLNYSDVPHWQKNCRMNDSNLMYVLADNSKFINMFADRCTFNFASLRNSLFANCSMHLSDFNDTDFRYSDIVLCSLGQSSFKRANLTNTNIKSVEFSVANLSNALFNSAELEHVIFDGADLSSINFTNSVIRNSVFIGCNVTDMLVHGAKFENCVFENINFYSVIGHHSCTFINSKYKNCEDAASKDLLRKISLEF